MSDILCQCKHRRPVYQGFCVDCGQKLPEQFASPVPSLLGPPPSPTPAEAKKEESLTKDQIRRRAEQICEGCEVRDMEIAKLKAALETEQDMVRDKQHSIDANIRQVTALRAQLAKKDALLASQGEELKQLHSHIDLLEQDAKQNERDLSRYEEMLGVLAGKMGIDISGCYDMGDTIGQIDAWYDDDCAALEQVKAERDEMKKQYVEAMSAIIMALPEDSRNRIEAQARVLLSLKEKT